MPIDYKDYGKDFVRISEKLRSYGYCAFCGAKNYKPNPRTGSRVVLTVHHVDKNIKNNSLFNLVPLCQQCHFAADRNKTPFWAEDCWMRYKRWLWERIRIYNHMENKA